MKTFALITTLLLVIACNQRPRQNVAYYTSLGSEPSTLNPISGQTEGATVAVLGYIFETLLDRDIDSYEWQPVLASKWEIADDKKTFTFTIRDGANWHDGKPITAEDVKFSFDILFQDKFNAAGIRSYYEGLQEVKVIDEKTVQFIAKDKYYKNFDRAAGMLIVPKHFYGLDEKKSYFNNHLLGSGPYKLELRSRGNRILLTRNNDWWGFKEPGQKEWNFEKIVLRFVKDPTVELEMLKKGSLDFISLRPDAYMKQTSGKEWGKTVHKVKTQNKAPNGFTFVGWNLNDPILKDKKVRLALSQLMNLELMIDKFEYNMSLQARGPVYPGSPYALKDINPIKFDPKAALQNLKDAGWKDTDGDNILDKVIDGKKTKLSITILEPYEPYVKYLTIFKEDAKKAGVEINIKLIEWSSFVKLLDERNFQAVRLAWSASVDWEPKQIWHSQSINGGSNFIGYNNKEIDKLIDEAREIHDMDERINVLNKVQRQIVDDVPYTWMITRATTLYGHTDRIKKEVESYNYGIGTSYWKFKSTIRED
jgi:ABC-type transport system substrate-binding protein